MQEEKLERELAPWVRWLARIGLIAKGVVYALIGGFSLHSAFGHSRPSGSSGVFASLGSEWLGMVLLALLGAGLICYVLWRLAQVVFGFALHAKSLTSHFARRFVCLCSAVFYGGLVIDVADHLFSRDRADHGETLARWTGWTMRLPLGRLVIAGIGIGLLIFAGWQLYRAASVRVTKRLRLRGHRSIGMSAIVAISEFGVLARGVVFALIGAFLLDAAWHYRAERSQGFPRALDTLRNLSYGHWLLGIVALGLIAYAVFQFARAGRRGIEAGNNHA
ncbi:MAG: DUF1206 domain-containing protein [Rhodanobacteraceae bacterium]|nr:DUF1206 domain-containing protein [Pseudomonadota bacterium]